MSAVSDQFAHSEDLMDEVVAEAASVDNLPVDVTNPGFASLLTLLREIQGGAERRGELTVYHRALTEHMVMARQQVASLQVHEAIKQQASAMLEATSGIFDHMDSVLANVGEYLSSGSGASVNAAVEALEALHGQVRGAF
ncbi:MAG: hypothetical protein FJX76_08925 [Armatimonadetes bacterium]|nr:hypothetical protein [Armatimonadota bacterium]